jgi:hypothetical protein
MVYSLHMAMVLFHTIFAYRVRFPEFFNSNHLFYIPIKHPFILFIYIIDEAEHPKMQNSVSRFFDDPSLLPVKLITVTILS